MRQRFATFAQFWPFYLDAHRSPVCRALHYVGGIGALSFVGLAIATRQPWWLAAAPVWGYAFAWAGHFGAEKNHPATFEYPLYSLLAEFRMLGLALTGRLCAEIERVDRARADDAR